MINKTLARRLEQLEERMLPTGEPMIINVVYVNPDGSVDGEPLRVEIPACGPAHQPRPGWKPYRKAYR